MINLSVVDEFLKELEEKKKMSEKSSIEEAIGFLEHTLDKFEIDFDRVKRRTRGAGIEESELTKIKKEIKDKILSILD